MLAAFGDERLAVEARRGNDSAFEVIYDRHHRGLLSFCRRMLRSQDEAEDALQQTFASAFGALQRTDQSIQVKPWLYTIARNRCVSMLRARREHPVEEVEVTSSTAGPSEEVERRAELRELLSNVDQLPERQRAALVLSEIGALDHPEVAQVLGCETRQVKALVFQARSALIADRRARETPCVEIREQLATATAGELRRGHLRRHVRQCEGCAAFREDVRDQRRLLAIALPVAPSLGLKESALAAAGVGGGGAAGGGGVLGGLGASGALKLAAIGVVAAGALGGVAATNPSLVDKAQAAVERAADGVLSVVSGGSGERRGEDA
ncbi:MAG: sigma-70 family RNA polymerase sigma factor, partial [Actinobacteria bacterium]|nr:sigma-70 family RNA polymerase sigma factor [Actinomycetota bacterium]